MSGIPYLLSSDNCILIASSENRYGGSKKCGMILLHGHLAPFPQYFTTLLTKWMGIRSDCVIKAPRTPGNSWYPMYMTPEKSVLSLTPGESKQGLEIALRSIESIIEDMINGGIPSDNIVVHGYSQGAGLTHYIAAHTKHKLGGFLATMGWLPLRLIEPVYKLKPAPVNINTPFLHVTGYWDRIVPNNPCGTLTRDDMQKMFRKYKHKPLPGSHFLEYSPVLSVVAKKWIKQNTNIGA